jgi:hypothetical protein
MTAFGEPAPWQAAHSRTVENGALPSPPWVGPKRCGEPDRKIDYLFASPAIEVQGSWVTSPSTNCDNPDPMGPAAISCSDHELLWAEVSVPH